MTIRLTKSNKTQALACLSKACEIFMFPYLSPTQIGELCAHLKLLRDGTDLASNCRFETIPETETTRIIIELQPLSLATGPVKQ